MVTDSIGNALFNRGNVIYLKLVGEEYPRKLGILDIENKTMFMRRESAKHLFRKNNSYGFNHTLLSTATKFHTVTLTIDKEVFIVPVDVILNSGKFLNFKQQGFELQTFLEVDIIQRFKKQ